MENDLGVRDHPAPRGKHRGPRHVSLDRVASFESGVSQKEIAETNLRTLGEDRENATKLVFKIRRRRVVYL